MEITNTIVTRTARHTAGEGVFNIDYTITNGKLDRIQLNIFGPPAEGEEESYLGSVYYDGRNVTCNIPWSDLVPYYFEQASEFISEILGTVESGDGFTEEAQEQPIDNKSR